MMRENQLKKKLDNGDVVVGSFVYVPSSKLTEIVGLAGFDFVVIDMEHGPVDTAVAEDMVRAAEIANTTPIIRVTHNDPSAVLRSLDIGAQAIHVPNVHTRSDAINAVANSKYGPVGTRGLAGVRANDYGLCQPLPQYASDANDQTMVIAHIEHIDAVNNLDELLSVDGIDVYYLGPQDLSNSLGIPGQGKDSRVVDLVESSIQRIAAAGRTAGCIATDPKVARRYIDLGARYIATHAIRHMVDQSQRFIQEISK
ncbi:MAG: aldolase/citrate lyase family protein [Pirellulaceae bacterium]|nr:aldolase/citrate lyase family protein [Pirellulaceae bacterium]